MNYVAVGALIAASLSALLFTLPDHARVERTAVVSAPPAVVYQLVSTTSGFNRFNPFRDADPELSIAASGPDAGVGASFAWEGPSGAGSQTIVEAVPDARVVMRLDLGFAGRPVQSFTISPAPGGTQVTWALDADFAGNPARRVFGLFLDRHLGPMYEAGLSKLDRLAAGS